MLGGFIVSLSLHALLFLAAVLVLPSPEVFSSEDEALPVEIIPIGEFTNLVALKEEQPPEPEPAAAVTPPEPEPEQIAALEELPPLPPLPEPEKVPEPKPEAQPETRAPELVPLPQQRPKLAEAKPEKKVPEKEKAREFNTDVIANLLDKLPEDSGRQKEPTDASKDTAALRPLSLSEVDALRQQIQQCWNPPPAVQTAQGLRVKIRVVFTPDGNFAGRPEVLSRGNDPLYLLAVESAVRGLIRCQPYDVPVDRFDAWREVDINYSPDGVFFDR